MEFADLHLADASYQREMIIFVSALIALLPPAADAALITRIRICLLSLPNAVTYCRYQAATHEAVVGHVLVDTERFWLEICSRYHHVHVLGPLSLNLTNDLGVKAEL